MRRWELGYLRFLFSALGDNAKIGSTGGPFFGIVFLCRSLALDFSFFTFCFLAM
jgi:hypothetical protein